MFVMFYIKSISENNGGIDLFAHVSLIHVPSTHASYISCVYRYLHFQCHASYGYLPFLLWCEERYCGVLAVPCRSGVGGTVQLPGRSPVPFVVTSALSSHPGSYFRFLNTAADPMRCLFICPDCAVFDHFLTPTLTTKDKRPRGEAMTTFPGRVVTVPFLSAWRSRRVRFSRLSRAGVIDSLWGQLGTGSCLSSRALFSGASLVKGELEEKLTG